MLKKSICNPFSFILFAICACILIFPHICHASSLNPITDIHDKFKTVLETGGLQAKLALQAEHLLFSIMGIMVTWKFVPMAIRQATFDEFIGELSKFALSMGFFLWLIRNGAAISHDILESFYKMAGFATGTGETVSPSSVLNIGFQAFHKVLTPASLLREALHPASTILYSIGATIFLLVLAAVSITLLLAIIKAWFVIYAGVVVLGLGAATWSQETIVNYFKSAISYGVKIFSLLIVVYACTGVLQQFIDKMENVDLEIISELLVLALITWMMAHKLPDVISGMVSGSMTSHSTFGQVAQNVKSIHDTAKAVGKAASAAYSGGGSLALDAATKLAKQAGQSAQGTVSGGAGDSKKPSPAPKMRQIRNASASRNLRTANRRNS